jgi:TctA family transporter
VELLEKARHSKYKSRNLAVRRRSRLGLARGLADGWLTVARGSAGGWWPGVWPTGGWPVAVWWVIDLAKSTGGSTLIFYFFNVWKFV